MADELQIWRCKNGHGLGIIQRVSQGADRLILYRNAVDSKNINPAEVDVIAVIESATDIRCSVCEEMRTWAPNQAALERLMSHYIQKEDQVKCFDSIC